MLSAAHRLASNAIPSFSALPVKNRSKLQPRRSHRKRLGLPVVTRAPAAPRARAGAQELLPDLSSPGRATLALLSSGQFSAEDRSHVLGACLKVAFWQGAPWCWERKKVTAFLFLVWSCALRYTGCFPRALEISRGRCCRDSRRLEGFVLRLLRQPSASTRHAVLQSPALGDAL